MLYIKKRGRDNLLRRPHLWERMNTMRVTEQCKLIAPVYLF
jgi:hypothetical protein